MKKVLILSDINLSHTQKWAVALSQKDFNIAIFSISKPKVDWYSKWNISLLSNSKITVSPFMSITGQLLKLKYLKQISALRKEINNFKPDIIHAHYATSYGLLGALTGFHPFVLSVWGSDVYDFPVRSVFNKILLKYNFKKADAILSTSNIKANEIAKYSSKKVYITPFGVDLDEFKPQQVNSLFKENDIVIGTIKSMEKKYGIDYLLRSFKLLKIKYPDLPLKLLIVGDGTQKEKLFSLAKKLSIDECTVFTGKIDQKEAALYHNMISVFVSVSILNSESFGVSAIEACACEKPVVVSAVDGFKEIIEHNVTGIIVPVANIEETAKGIEFFMLDKQQSLNFGKNGRARVSKLYDLKNNVQTMVGIYKDILLTDK